MFFRKFFVVHSSSSAEYTKKFTFAGVERTTCEWASWEGFAPIGRLTSNLYTILNTFAKNGLLVIGTITDCQRFSFPRSQRSRRGRQYLPITELSMTFLNPLIEPNLKRPSENAHEPICLLFPPPPTCCGVDKNKTHER